MNADHMSLYTTSPWPNIVTLYRSSLEGYGRRFTPMFALLEQIASSPYACGLYGNKSMWDLLVVQTPKYNPDGEILFIKYHPARLEFTFELQETSSTKYKRWTRKSSAEDAFQTFERFLQLKKWFVVLPKRNV